MENILYPEQIKYLSSFIENKNPLLKEMEEFASVKHIPILDKLSAEFLEQLVILKKPENSLELGTAIGYSSIRIAKNLKEGGKLDTIEFSKHNIPLAESYIQRSGYSEKINLVFSDAKDFLKTVQKKYDFVFLDADKEDYAELLDLLLPVLNSGGILLTDNLLWHSYAAREDIEEKYKNSARHIKDFNGKLFKKTELITSLLPIGDGLGLSIKR